MKPDSSSNAYFQFSNLSFTAIVWLDIHKFPDLIPDVGLQVNWLHMPINKEQMNHAHCIKNYTVVVLDNNFR